MNEYDYLAKAKKNMEKEKYREVISLCDKALKINEDLAEAYSFRGNALYNLGEYNDAAESFSHAIEKEPDEAEHYYDRSWSYRNMYKMEDSIVDINKALEIKPKTSLYYYDKGRFEYLAERYKEAIVDFTKGIELNATENKFHFRAICHMELEEYDLAMADLNSAIEINPDFAPAYYNKGLLFKKMELLDKAQEEFIKALKLNPKDDDAMIELGLIKIQLGEKDVMEYFKQAIHVYPCSGNYYWKIRARQKILHRKEVLAKLAKGKLTEDDCDKNKIFNKKQAKDDIKDLDIAIILNPEDIPLYEMRAERYRYLKEYQKAIDDYDFLIEENPDNVFYYTMRSFCYSQTGEYKKSADDFEKILELKPADAFIIRTYACLDNFFKQ